MSSTSLYDCLIIGSGQSGTPLASAFAKAGHKTALIERTHIGGCCINEGCTPTKTMIASGRAAYLTRRGADYGIHTPGGVDGKLEIDMMKIRQRKRDIVESFRQGSEKRTIDAGVEIINGEGSFVDSKTVEVQLENGTKRTMTASKIFINTGERPATPHLDGLSNIPSDRVLDSTSIQELASIPEHLLVLGGGPIGLEFSQLFRRLGAKITIIQRSAQLLPREDPEIAESMLQILRQDGITIHLSTRAASISAPPTSCLNLTVCTTNGAEQTISGSHLFFAAGRVPNTESLNLSAAGISTTKSGYIICNERLETSVPGIYALGDVKGPPAFTHVSYDDFRILRANLLLSTSPPLTTSNRILPYVVYTDPQLGHVGLHAHEALAKYPNRDVKTASMPMAYVARALETDEARGIMKAVVDGESGEILGFTCLGMEGGELMSVVQVAIMGGVKYGQLADAVFAHPSLAESLNNLWGFLK
ncbi:MAG: hypothetical protein M1836_001074 [Candelina mexicana]|nr:MAG: hypothetical protein M1836_001074 [Candelina mexicana]